jgi:hypothetical protein
MVLQGTERGGGDNAAGHKERMMRFINIRDLLGVTLTAVEISDDKQSLILRASHGRVFKACHSQDCCESVDLNEVDGDLEWLIGSEIILAAEEVSTPAPANRKGGDDSETWTFYKLGTVKGAVTFRWVGSSNGYYSEDVCFWEE